MFRHNCVKDMVRHLKLNSRPRTEEFVEQRAAAIRGALRDAGAGPGAELPAVLIENSSRCDTNAAGQQVLPNEEAWLPALMTSVRSHPISNPNPQTVRFSPVQHATAISCVCITTSRRLAGTSCRYCSGTRSYDCTTWGQHSAVPSSSCFAIVRYGCCSMGHGNSLPEAGDVILQQDINSSSELFSAEFPR